MPRKYKYKGKGFFTQTLRSMNMYHEPSTSKLLSNLQDLNKLIHESNVYNISPILNGWVIHKTLIPQYAKKFVDTYVFFSEMTEVHPVLKAFIFDIKDFNTYYAKHTKPKSITLYIQMHGQELVDKPLTIPILNTVVSKIGRLGICSWGRPLSFTVFFEKLKELNTVFDGPSIIQNNIVYSKTIHNKISKQLETTISNYHDAPWSTLAPDYKTAIQYTSNEHIRSYLHDKMFAIEYDFFSLIQGIYIVGAHNIDLSLSKILKTPSTINIPEPDVMLVNNLERILNISESMKYYKINQSYNILNINYLNHLSTTITGQSFGIENSVQTNEFTYIPHYKRVYLSDILNYFKKLGFDHVNILDDSCRSIDVMDYPPELLRKESFSEQQGWRDFTKTHPTMGGRKNYTRKNKKCYSR
jgi:hypothetical protein